MRDRSRKFDGMSDIILATVPHTGTRWTEALFTRHRPKWMCVNFDYDGPLHQFPHLYVGHCMGPWAVKHILPRAMDGTHLVMTMRHPYRVEESWRRRGKELTDLMKCYIAWLDHLTGYVSAYVPIDGTPACKSGAEKALNHIAGVELKYDWNKKENVDPKSCTYELSIADCDPSEAIRQVRAHPVFTEFYGTQKEEDAWAERMTQSDGAAKGVSGSVYSSETTTHAKSAAR